MKIVDFYKEVILSFGLEEEDGYIKASGEKVMIKDRPLVLPTKHHLDTAVENGVAIKYVFNILAENVTSIRLDLQYLLKVMKVNFNIAVAHFLSEILQKFHSSLDDLSADMLELLSLANKAKGSAKTLVDDNTIKILNELIKEPNFVDIKLVRALKKDDEKLKFGIRVKSSILEYLNSEEIKEDKLWKRRKDRDLFKILLDFLIGDVLDTVVGSNHNKAPDALAVLKFNLDASEYFKGLGEDLDIENIYPECKYSARQLSDKIINIYIGKANLIIDSEEFLAGKIVKSTTNTPKTKRKKFNTTNIDEGQYVEDNQNVNQNNINNTPYGYNNVPEEIPVNRPINNPDIVYQEQYDNRYPRPAGYRDPGHLGYSRQVPPPTPTYGPTYNPGYNPYNGYGRGHNPYYPSPYGNQQQFYNEPRDPNIAPWEDVISPV